MSHTSQTIHTLVAKQPTRVRLSVHHDEEVVRAHAKGLPTITIVRDGKLFKAHTRSDGDVFPFVGKHPASVFEVAVKGCWR